MYALSRSLDPRLVPVPQLYDARQGAQAVTQVNYVCTQLNQSQHVFVVTPPSPGVVIQNNPFYDLESVVTFTASHKMGKSGQWPVYGRDFAIAKTNPLNSMVTNWQCQINNTTTQWQNTASGDLSHLLETKKSRTMRGTNHRNPSWTCWDDGEGTTTGLGSAADSIDGDVPPGAYNVDWVVPQGATLFGIDADGLVTGRVASATVLPGNVMTTRQGVTEVLRQFNTSISVCYDLTGGDLPDQSQSVMLSCPILVGPAANFGFISAGTPAWLQADQQAVVNAGSVCYAMPNSSEPQAGIPYIFSSANIQACTFSIYSRIIDPIQCPPFGYSPMTGMHSQGMWGVTNATIMATLSDPGQARWLQGSSRSGTTSLTYKSWSATKAQVWFNYLSPGDTPSMLLPARCVMPLLYKQYTQYTPQVAMIQPGESRLLQIPNYQFASVANAIVISVRPLASPPSAGSNATGIPFNEPDFCLAYPDSPFSQFQFANMSGMLSNISSAQLLLNSKRAGLVSGVISAMGGSLGFGAGGSQNGKVMKAGQLTGVGGAPIVLTPGLDFQLPTYVVGGTGGNVQIQFSLTVINQGRRACPVQINTTAISTGYFVIEGGNSASLLVGLDEEAVHLAPIGPDSYSTHSLSGGGFMDTLSNAAGFLWKHNIAVDGHSKIMAAHEASKGAGFDDNRGGKRGRTDGPSGRREGSLLEALYS